MEENPRISGSTLETLIAIRFFLVKNFIVLFRISMKIIIIRIRILEAKLQGSGLKICESGSYYLNPGPAAPELNPTPNGLFWVKKILRVQYAKIHYLSYLLE